MHGLTDKTQKNTSRSIADAVSEKNSAGLPAFQIENNRPEAVAQRKLQEMANNYQVIQRVRLGIRGSDGEFLDTDYLIDIHNYILENLNTGNQAAINNLRIAVGQVAMATQDNSLPGKVDAIIDNLTQATRTQNEKLRSSPSSASSSENALAPPKKRGGSLAAAMANLPARPINRAGAAVAASAQPAAATPMSINITFAPSGSAFHHLNDKLDNGTVISKQLIRQRIAANIDANSPMGDDEISLGMRTFVNRGGNRDAVEYYIRYRINRISNNTCDVFCWHAGPSGTGRR